MNKYFPNLFSPIYVNGKRFRNRIVAAPTLPSELTEQGYLPDMHCKCYESKAKGGAAIVTIGETAVDWEYAKTHYSQINIWGEKAGVQLANVVDSFHHAGALASIELCHGGVWSNLEVIGNRNPIGPSSVIRNDGVEVKEMTEEQIFQVADHFAEATAICKRCGFDAVMLHAAHGWLLGAFLSPFDNHRTDKYGGSLENRARMPLLVLDRIRESVGDEFIIDMRLSVSEGIPGGFEPEEAVQFVKMAEAHGLSVISQSYGTRWSTRTRGRCTPSSFYDYGCNLEYAKALKDGGVKIPVSALGSLDNPDIAEKAIKEGLCDFIALGRAFVADPNWAVKAKNGKSDEICTCIKCSKYCSDIPIGRDNKDALLKINPHSTHRFGCAVNPEMGRLHYPPVPLAEPQKVFVVGGGPAGMQAAIIAANRGHKVTLFEETGSLGGALKFSDNVEFKKFIKLYKEYMIRMVGKKDIEVRLNSKATPDLLAAEEPDVIIAALGAAPICPKIPGIDGKNVMYAADAFHCMDRVGKKIVVVGGGQVGTETALHMALSGRQVSIIEMTDLIARDASFTYRVQLMERSDNLFDVYVNTTCKEIGDNYVKVTDKNDNEIALEADTVIIAVGMKGKIKEAEAFEKIPCALLLAGDVVSVKDIGNATKTGYDAAMQI